MNRSRIFAVAGILVLSACGGAGSSSSYSPSQAAPQAPATFALSPDHAKKRNLGRISFHIRIPRKHKRSGNERVSPHFIPASTAAVTIVLNTVNGAAPPAGLVTTKTTSISSATCGGVAGCKVAGPSSPVGSDNFTVTVKDGSGHALSLASITIVVKAGMANTNGTSLTLLGIPASLSIAGVPTGAAGTAIAKTTLTVTAFDAAGDTITGSYANPVFLSDNDGTGATLLFLNGGGSGATSKVLSGSSDTLQLQYSGLAIAAATLTAQADGATEATAQFAPTVSNPTAVCNGDGSGTTECASPAPGLQLYATTSTGSTASFTPSQTGWSESPYLKIFTETDDCSGIATITTNDNVIFHATVANGAVPSTCDITIHGGAALTLDVPLSYATSSVGVFGRHRTPKAPHSQPHGL
ncbi:MAG TPA: hypothetical protein VK760_09060 [Candidatus Acidoferrales bacterium]|jgi:hypothetical protein|nr:hypothetical protein [Candidatus Acidoferrales bacterium]